MYNLENNNQVNTYPPHNLSNKDIIQIPYKSSCTPFLYHSTLFPSGVTFILNFLLIIPLLYCYMVFVDIRS